jgi:hypothetical protein
LANPIGAIIDAEMGGIQLTEAGQQRGSQRFLAIALDRQSVAFATLLGEIDVGSTIAITQDGQVAIQGCNLLQARLPFFDNGGPLLSKRVTVVGLAALGGCGSTAH